MTINDDTVTINGNFIPENWSFYTKTVAFCSKTTTFLFNRKFLSKRLLSNKTVTLSVQSNRFFFGTILVYLQFKTRFG